MLLSLFGVALLLSVGVLLLNWRLNPFVAEPALEAHGVAETLEGMGWPDRYGSQDVDTLLVAFADGTISPNPDGTDIDLTASIGRWFANVDSISVIDPSGRILSSSDTALIGQSVDVLGLSTRGVVDWALAGHEGERSLSTAADDESVIAGAYPVRQSVDGAATVIGAVVVVKERRTFPGTFSGVMSLAARYALAVSVFMAVLIGIPAILMALVVGINRARSIVRPVNDLARAAERLAAGDLSVRVWVPTDDEVARLARAFNRMGDRLQLSLEQEADARARAERLLATNRDLVANVSHELRTPVALIRGHIEALADEPDRLDDYAAIALRESDRLEDLVNDLFQLARIDAQGLQMEMVPFDAGAAAREATESLAGPVRRDAGITMTSVIQGDTQRLIVVGDRARLVQVIQNLLRNAVRYTPEGGLIRVVVAPEGESVVIRVQDTGVGIAPEDLERVFDRFFRSDQRHSRKGGGAGLGLAIARQSIEGMGGRITVESILGEGTVFTITLPRAAHLPAVPIPIMATSR